MGYKIHYTFSCVISKNTNMLSFSEIKENSVICRSLCLRLFHNVQERGSVFMDLIKQQYFNKKGCAETWCENLV